MVDTVSKNACHGVETYTQSSEDVTEINDSNQISPKPFSEESEISNERISPRATAIDTPCPSIAPSIARVTTRGTTYTSDPSFEVDWEDEDPRNPRNWPLYYKCLVLFFLAFTTTVVVLYSTAYTSGVDAIMADLHVDSTAVVTLGLTTYLVGLAVGSTVLAPISETVGRKPVYVVSMLFFFVLIIPCARASNVITLIVVRFLCAFAGSALIANAPGTIGDIISEEYRSVAFSLWSIGPMNGPVLGPLYGSWVTQYIGWRWMTWIILILGFVSFLMMASIEETYAPALLQAKARRLRMEKGEDRYWSRFDVKVRFWKLMKINLSRPFVMAVTEPICIFWNVYIGVVYAILYLGFASYPIVYHEQRGWSLGQSSLAFVGIGVGVLLTICCASPIKRMVDSHKPDASGHIPPESTMSVVCIAAILVPVGELWFAWTCMPVSIHPAISIAAGIPFGAGNSIIFIYASNYLVGSYGIYAASALVGNTVVRSVLGGVLPLAGAPLYQKLGANWAGTLLGLLEVLIIPVPFVFYRYGAAIRARSSLIRRMREIEEKQEQKSRRNRLGARSAKSEDAMTAKHASVNVSESEVSDHSTGVHTAGLDIEQQAEVELSRLRGVITEVREEVKN